MHTFPLTVKLDYNVPFGILNDVLEDAYQTLRMRHLLEREAAVSGSLSNSYYENLDILVFTLTVYVDGLHFESKRYIYKKDEGFKIIRSLK